MFPKGFSVPSKSQEIQFIIKADGFCEEFLRTLVVTLIVSSIDSLTAEVTWITPELTQVRYS